MNTNPWKTDRQFENYRIAKVEEHDTGYTMHLEDAPVVGTAGVGGVCFGLSKEYGIKPRVGDLIALWGKGFGYTVRGCAVAGIVAYYRTEAEDKEHFRAEQTKRDDEKRAKFETNRADHDRRIAALPALFRARFERFVAGHPDFRWQFEDYELFSCEEAVKFAAAAVDAKGAAGPVEWLRVFYDAPYETQRKLVPTMSDGHSGNTFGSAVMLARAYLTDETLVPKMHGALTPLVGCKDYGCMHARTPGTGGEG